MSQQELVAYFSASGTTETVARELASGLGADLYEIIPETPYSTDDLNWNNRKSRSSIEMHNKTSRPSIAACELELSAYGTIYLGFPIWWYAAPTIINTFLETYDFSDRNIIIFATSGGSDFGQTIAGLKGSVADTCEIKEGRVISAWRSNGGLEKWLEELNELKD